MNSISSVGLSGLNSAMLMMQQSAQAVARSAAPDSVDAGELTQALAQERVALYAFKANLKVVQTGDQVLGSLLNAIA